MAVRCASRVDLFLLRTTLNCLYSIQSVHELALHRLTDGTLVPAHPQAENAVIASMPGAERHSLASMVAEAKDAWQYGVRSFILFPKARPARDVLCDLRGSFGSLYSVDSFTVF